MNDTLENALKKLNVNRQKQIEDACYWVRVSIKQNGLPDTITASNVLRLEDVLFEAKSSEMTDREFRAMRLYYLKQALTRLEGL